RPPLLRPHPRGLGDCERLLGAQTRALVVALVMGQQALAAQGHGGTGPTGDLPAQAERLVKVRGSPFQVALGESIAAHGGQGEPLASPVAYLLWEAQALYEAVLRLHVPAPALVIDLPERVQQVTLTQVLTPKHAHKLQRVLKEPLRFTEVASRVGHH